MRAPDPAGGKALAAWLAVFAGYAVIVGLATRGASGPGPGWGPWPPGPPAP
jgi:hypothetical protein